MGVILDIFFNNAHLEGLRLLLELLGATLLLSPLHTAEPNERAVKSLSHLCTFCTVITLQMSTRCCTTVSNLGGSGYL